ncbi:MAG: SLBB domain-containing protein [Bacteroidaceae bacterium]
MNKIISKVLFVFFLLVISGTSVAFAQQMADDQIVAYVLQEQAKGTSQQEVVTELLRRGVSIDQLKRLKSRYETNEKTGFVGEVVKKQSRMRTSSEKEDMNAIKDFTSKQDATSSTNQTKLTKDYSDALSFLYTDSLQLEVKNEKEIYGHSIFSDKKLTFEPNLNIATPQNYQLGPGDEVIVDIWGASQTTIQDVISPDGCIQVDNLGPVYLSGMSIKEANNYLRSEFSKIYSGISGENPNSHIKLTLGQARSIQVNVMGEANAPGTYQLSSFASVFRALYQAGGVNDIGSLRDVKVYRSNKLVTTFDIYDFILNGKVDTDIRLMDNDVVVIPPYHSLVEVVGKVKRPMFYELKKGETLASLLNYAGGLKGDAYKDYVRIVRQSNNEHEVFTISPDKFESFQMMDADSVAVDSVLQTYANRVQIKGAVYRPGSYQVGATIHTLRDLLDAVGGVRGDAFLSRAVMHRRNPDLTITATSINVKGVIDGEVEDVQLKKDDVIFIPSVNDLQEDKTLTIYGKVAFPGIYKYAQDTSLEDLILQSGGLLESASTVRVDVSRRIKDPKATSTDNVIAKTYSFALKDGFVVDGKVGFVLQPFDEVYVRRSPGYQNQQNIEVNGEVLFPGKYALVKKNQRLSEVILAAGGLTPDAYAKGARLKRKMSDEEKVRMKSLLRIAAASKGSKQDSISTKTLDLGDSYYVGIQLDQALHNPGSDADIVLHENDEIYIPQFSSTVKINGAVMYPNTVAYKHGEKKKYYVNMAGGYSLTAKKRRAYVVYMNGTVARLRSGDKDAIQPGCEIVIPSKKQKGRMSLPEILSIGTSTASIATMIATMSNIFK